MTDSPTKQEHPLLRRLLTVYEARQTQTLGIGRTAAVERLDLDEDGEALGGLILVLIEEVACA